MLQLSAANYVWSVTVCHSHILVTCGHHMFVTVPVFRHFCTLSVNTELLSARTISLHTLRIELNFDNSCNTMTRARCKGRERERERARKHAYYNLEYAKRLEFFSEELRYLLSAL
jgi:hypothetical protein